MSLRIAIVQFCPKIGQVQANIETATRLCSQIKPNSVDLICLPEMIFTGYVFPSAASILPYLEEPKIGPTSVFCADLAKRLHCYVAAGYPERLAPAEPRNPVLSGSQDDNGESILEVGANSAVLYSPDGNFIGNYRKTNPYETDMTWAKPGAGFATYSLSHPIHTMALGICMDLNAQPPAEWTLEDGPYELAGHCIEKKANVLLLLNAWLDSGMEEADKDWQTLNFWAARLRPLWAMTEELQREEDESSDDYSDSDNESGDEERKADDGDSQVVAEHRHRPVGQETIVILCNRCGEENGETFAGSSAVFSLVRGSGRPKLLQAMGRKEEGVAIWTI